MLNRILITILFSGGSPTLLIEGKDVEDLPSSQNPSLACRSYPGGVLSAEIIRYKIFLINK